MMRKPTIRCAIPALFLSFAFVPSSANAIPVHAHGDPWTSFERDGDRGGAVALEHAHPSPGGHEAGDESHQHFDTVPIPGPAPAGGIQPWAAYGAWDNRRAFVDADVPFTDKVEYTANRVSHGYIEETAWTMPRYTFDDNVPNDVIDMITIAFDLWDGIEARRSPTTGKKLDTGIGFTHEGDNKKAHEMRVHWINDNGNSGGGFVEGLAEGTYGAADVIDVSFDNSMMWDFTLAGLDLTSWHFLSVALHEIGHMMFLEHSPTRDTDLMQPTVGAPLGVGVGALSYRWNGYVDASGEADDRFTGTRYERVALTAENPRGVMMGAISDRDSPRAIKALYSIPVPEPATALLLVLGITALTARERRA